MRTMMRQLRRRFETTWVGRTIKDVGYRRWIDPTTERGVVDQFHRLYYHAAKWRKTWTNTRWLGVEVLKCPLDLWIYQELIYRVRPEWIVECGTKWGGSAMFLASICDLIGQGQIVTVDIKARPGQPRHARLHYLVGDSVDPQTVARVRKTVASAQRVMVILDSDHRAAHVARELEWYGPLVTKGSYIIVEDSNINGHPVAEDFGPGPFEAIAPFLAGHPEFVIDADCEKFFLTFNPSGYLRKIR